MKWMTLLFSPVVDWATKQQSQYPTPMSLKVATRHKHHSLIARPSAYSNHPGPEFMHRNFPISLHILKLRLKPGASIFELQSKQHQFQIKPSEGSGWYCEINFHSNEDETYFSNYNAVSLQRKSIEYMISF